MSHVRAPRTRRTAGALAAVLVLAAGVVACEDDERSPRLGPDWSPAPRTEDDLRVVATAADGRLLLHTADGDRPFLPGVTLGNSVPGGPPGDVAGLDVPTYRAWFRQMRGLGVRAVRTYAVQPPAFYAALVAHNGDRPDEPLYLLQGVPLPEQALAAPGARLSDEQTTAATAAAVEEASAAVHGDLPADAGRPAYRVDASAWVAGWIVGSELAPDVVERTDAADVPYPPGELVTASPEATPTERWLAHQLDGLAAAERDRGSSAPLAFVSSPTTDPLDHPEEPVAAEDRVSVDPRHVVATGAWPGGIFAAMHAYPYYPDFLRHESGLAETTWDGAPDPYAGYLAAMRDHLGPVPLLVAETGVPASIGSAHRGPRERNQGPHSEHDAMEIGADLVRLAHDQGTAGALLSSWTDEWWRGDWNTAAGRDAATRYRWHDPLTASQWTGVLRSDAPFVPDSLASAPGTGDVERLVAQASGSFLHLLLRGGSALPGRTRITVDSLPGGGPEHVIAVDPDQGRAQVLVRADVDSLRHYAGEPLEELVGPGRWHLWRQLTNGRQVMAGTSLPPESSAVGDLVRGTWSPADEDYDSRATWQTVERDRSLRLRVPWSMLGFTDPSQRSVLAAGDRAESVPVPGIGIVVRTADGQARMRYSWPTWTRLTPELRLSAGSGTLADSFAAVVVARG